MTIPENENGSSSNEVAQADSSVESSLERFMMELASINQGIQTIILEQRMNGTWFGARYGIGNEADDADDFKSENFSVFNYADEDDDYQSPFQCPSCDLGINLSMLRSSLEEMDCYDPKNMLCPVCDENLGEDATKIVQNSSSTKPAWKSEKSTAWSSNSSMLDKKLIGMGNKHEPVADTLLSPFLCNVSGLNSSGVLPNEDSFYKALGISIAKSSRTDAAADAGNEQDREERRARASFVQELVASTLLENSVP